MGLVGITLIALVGYFVIRRRSRRHLSDSSNNNNNAGIYRMVEGGDAVGVECVTTFDKTLSEGDSEE